MSSSKKIKHDRVMVSVMQTRIALRTAERAGVDPAEVLAAAEIDPAILENPFGQVTAAQEGRMFREAIRLTGDRALPLRSGVEFETSDLDLMGFLIQSCSNAAEAIAVGGRYFEIFNTNLIQKHLEMQGDTCISTLISNIPDEEDRIPVMEFVIGAVCVGSWKMFCLEGFAMDQVYLPYPRPSYAGEIEALLGCPVEFDAENYQYRFSSHWLSIPFAMARPELKVTAQAHMDEVIRKYMPANLLSREVRDFCREKLLNGGESPRLIDLAEHMQIDARTLQNRLQREGHTFSMLLDQARTEMALDYLTQPHLTLEEIAAKLGFQESASFSRAFRRWTGRPPRGN